MKNFEHLIDLGHYEAAALEELHFICKSFAIELEIFFKEDCFSCFVTNKSKLKKANFNPILFNHENLNLPVEVKEVQVEEKKRKTKKQLKRIAQKERVKVVNGKGCKIEYKVFDEKGEGDLIKTYFSYEEIPEKYWTEEYCIVHDYYSKFADDWVAEFWFKIEDYI